MIEASPWPIGGGRQPALIDTNNGRLIWAGGRDVQTNNRKWMRMLISTPSSTHGSKFLQITRSRHLGRVPWSPKLLGL